MKNKILTVIIPMYNVELYIEQCLKSFMIPEVMDQIEILIVDDGGKDTSAMIAERYQKRYPETYRLIHKENGGHGSTVNMGIDLACGKYLKVVDGDDWVDRDAFVHLVQHLTKMESDMVLSNYCWVNHTTGEKRAEVKEICSGIQYGKLYAFEEIANNIFMKMHAITYKTSIIRSQPERLDEHCFYVDTEYVLFPLPYVKTVSAIPDFVYQYRIGLPGQSMSIENMKRRCSQHERVLFRLLDFYKQHEINSCSAIIEKTIARISTSQFKIYLMFKESHKSKLISLDRELYTNYNLIYKQITNPCIAFLRATRYRTYLAVSFIVRIFLCRKG